MECGECEDPSVTHWCENCQINLCEDCMKVHRKKKATLFHTLTLASPAEIPDELSASEVEGELQLKVRGLMDKWPMKQCSFHPATRTFRCDGTSMSLPYFILPSQTIKSRPFRFNVGGQGLGGKKAYEVAAVDSESSRARACRVVHCDVRCTRSGERGMSDDMQQKTFLDRLLPMEEVSFIKAIVSRLRSIYTAGFEQDESTDGAGGVSTDGTLAHGQSGEQKRLSVSCMSLRCVGATRAGTGKGAQESRPRIVRTDRNFDGAPCCKQ
jgi:hypothetical protein